VRGKGIGKDEAKDPPGQPETLSGPAREAVLRKLEPADRTAYFSFQYAETKAEKRLEDQEAYRLLKEEGIPTDKGDLGELTDYCLPSFDTWSRQLRNARKALGERKYTPRDGRDAGSHSVVPERGVEFQRGDEQ
jgi:hypothetical protein